MKPYTDAEKEAFHSGRQKYLRLVFSDGTIIENPDIASESMNFTQAICDEAQLTIGRCSSASFKVKLLGVAQRYAGLTVMVTISAIDSENVTHTRNIGTFKVISDKATSDKLYRELECYDALYDILSTDYSEWYNALSFPMTLKTYRDAFFTHVGITQETVTLVNDNMQVTKNFVAENYSGSELLQDICEINGVFGILNCDNRFQYITVQPLPEALFPSDDLYPADDLYPIDASDFIAKTITKNDYYMGTLTYEEYTCQKITQLQIRMSENDIGAIVGTPGNTYIIQDNPLVYGKTTEQLAIIGTAILDNISNISYIPMSIQMGASLWWELGDSVRIQGTLDTVPTVFLSVSLTGITALKQRFESKGQEYYTEKANSTERSILVVKQKTNELERNVEETKSTITEVQQDLDNNVETLQSQITQNATSITAEVTRATTAENTILADYTNTYLPTNSNAPANSWGTDDVKSQHIGEIFYNSTTGKYYEWQCEGLAVNFSGMCSTERSYDYVYVIYYDGSEYIYSKMLSGGRNGSENDIAGATVFVPSSTVYIEWVTDSNNADWGFKIDSITKTTGRTDNGSQSALVITVTEPIISGVTNLPESDHPYTTNVSKVYQIDTGISVAGFHWVEVGNNQSTALRSVIKQTADEILHEVTDVQNGLSSSIKQTANSVTSEVTRATTAEGTLASRVSQTESDITLKVSKGTVSSELSIEDSQVTISSNRLVVNSTNFQLTKTGIITASGANIEGELKTGTSGYYIYMNGDTIQGKNGSSNTGSIQLTGQFSNLYGNVIYIKSTNIALEGKVHVYVNNEFGYDFAQGTNSEYVSDINYETRYWCDWNLPTEKTYCIPTRINSDGTVADYEYGARISRWEGSSAYGHSWGYVRKGIVIGYLDSGEVIDES